MTECDFQGQFTKVLGGLPWQSSGYDSALPLQGARVWSLFGGTKIPHAARPGRTKKKKKNPTLLSLGSLALGEATCHGVKTPKQHLEKHTWQGTEAPGWQPALTCQVCERPTLEADPTASVRPSDDHSPRQYLDGKIVGDPEPETAQLITHSWIPDPFGTVWDHKCLLFQAAKFGGNLFCSNWKWSNYITPYLQNCHPTSIWLLPRMHGPWGRDPFIPGAQLTSIACHWVPQRQTPCPATSSRVNGVS